MNSRSEEEISNIIAKSLQLVLSGKTTIESVLFKYPELADVIRPELENAVWLSRMSTQFKPSVGFVTASRKRLISRIESDIGSNPARARQRSRKTTALFNQPWVWRLGAVMAVLLLMFMSFTGTVYAARDTIPGDTLYSFKRWTETTTYSLTRDIERRAELSLAYSSRRLDEANLLIAHNRPELVAETLAEFERDVNQAVALLQEIESAQGDAQSKLAAAMKSELDRQTLKLSAMVERSTPDHNVGLLRALEVSQRNSAKVKESVDRSKNPGVLNTEIPVPTNVKNNQGNPDPSANKTENAPVDKGNPNSGKDNSNSGKGNEEKGSPSQSVDSSDDQPGRPATRTPEPTMPPDSTAEPKDKGKPTDNSSTDNSSGSTDKGKPIKP